MELLGNENKSETLLIKLQETNRKLLISPILSESELKDILLLLDTLINSGTDIFAYSGEIFSLLLLLSNTVYKQQFPLLNNLMTELKLKLLRFICQSSNVSKNSSLDFSVKNPADNSREQFLPTPNDNFVLPPPGETTNLTVTAPNRNTGKNLIRELIIDHNGYVVTEQSRRYEDIYTDESEKIYNDAYLKELHTLQKSNPRLSTKNPELMSDIKTSKISSQEETPNNK